MNARRFSVPGTFVTISASLALCVAACSTGVSPGADSAADVAADTGCGRGQSVCGGRCVDTQTDDANCGACGMSCRAGAHQTNSCSAGRCTPACATGFADCDGDPTNGCEADTSSSGSACGGCGRACMGPGAVCGAGVCAAGMCPTGMADCDAMPANGCEVDTAGNASNCGACGRACSAPNSAPACRSGVCIVGACNAGFGDCDGVIGNGCEADTNTSVIHCGACGRGCSAIHGMAACAMGVCTISSCEVGYADCDRMGANGCESNTASDSANCGMCGRACPMGQACGGGVCRSFTTVAPVRLMTPPGCTTGSASNGHKAAVDGRDTLYAAMLCAGSVWVAASTSNGTSWSPAVDTHIVMATEVAIAGLPSGGVVVAAARGDGTVAIAQSTDRGMTYPASPTVLSTVPVAPAGPGFAISVATRGTTTLIAWPTMNPTQFGVARSAAGSPFVSTAITITGSNYAPEIGYDGATVWLAYEANPGATAGAYRSMDDGVTFPFGNSMVMSPHAFSDFGVGGGNLFCTGTGGTVERASLATITMTAAPVTSFMVGSSPMGPGRSVTADGMGTGYIASDGVEVQRVGDTTGRTIGMGQNPSVAALPTNNGVVVVYGDGMSVFASVQTF